jgi:hypothetical protein
MFDAGADRRALASPLRKADELDTLRRRDGVEAARGLVVRAVVHEDERGDVLKHALDERVGGHVAVRRHDRGDRLPAQRFVHAAEYRSGCGSHLLAAGIDGACFPCSLPARSQDRKGEET